MVMMVLFKEAREAPADVTGACPRLRVRLGIRVRVGVRVRVLPTGPGLLSRRLCWGGRGLSIRVRVMVRVRARVMGR